MRYPNTYNRIISMVIVAMFVAFFYYTYVPVFLVMIRVILVEGEVRAARITFYGLVRVCPMVATWRVFCFTMVFNAIATWIRSPVGFETVARGIKGLYMRVPIRLVNVTFFGRISNAASKAVR